jgi:hypothetical protein
MWRRTGRSTLDYAPPVRRSFACFPLLLACGSPQAVPAARPPTPPSHSPEACFEPAAPNASTEAPTSPAPPPETNGSPFAAVDAKLERDCFLAEELASPYNPAILGDAAPTFAKLARERLLETDEAEQLAVPAAWRALDALAAGRFAAVAAMLGKEGLCLRAAKGAGCIQLSAAEVSRCGADTKKVDYPIDTGQDGPQLFTCSEAIRKIFLKRDMRRPSGIRTNCFPPPGRGNNSGTILLRPASAFVEFHVASEPWQSLWFVFDESPETPHSDQCDSRDDCDARGQRLYLVELVAEYWGI